MSSDPRLVDDGDLPAWGSAQRTTSSGVHASVVKHPAGAGVAAFGQGGGQVGEEAGSGGSASRCWPGRPVSVRRWYARNRTEEALSTEYIEVRLRASQLRLGDRLIGESGKPGAVVTQVTIRDGEIRVSHPGGQTRLVGDPPIRVLRRKPRIEVDDDLPAPIWRPRGPRRTQPWENDT